MYAFNENGLIYTVYIIIYVQKPNSGEKLMDKDCHDSLLK